MAGHAHGPDCGCPTDGEIDLAAGYVLARLSILKAAGLPELARIAAGEIALREALVEAHREAGEAATKAAVAILEGGARPNARTVARVVAAVRKTYNGILLPAARKALTKAIPEFYRAGREVAWKKATGQTGATLRYDLPPDPSGEPVAKGLPKGTKFAQVKPAFDVIDDDAMQALVDHQVFWVGDHFEDNVSGRIAAVARAEIVERGLGGADAAPILGDALRREFDLVPGAYTRPPGVPIPEGWKGTSTAYFHGVAANAATTGRVSGSVRSLEQSGVSRVQIVNPLDERTCLRCRVMDGKRFTIQQAAAQVRAVLASKTKAAVKSAHPWKGPKAFKGIKAGHVSDGDSSALAALGICLPPYHFSCRCTVDVADDATLLPLSIPEDLPPHRAPFPWAESDLLRVTKSLGGAHEKEFFKAPDGSEWMFKPAANEGEAFLAHAEKAASDLALDLDVPAAEIHVVTLKGRTGSIHRLFEGVEGDFEGRALVTMTDDEIDESLRQTALNWLLGDNDAHTGNFLRVKGQGIVGIDHGQVFKFFDRDDLFDLDYRPNGGCHAGALNQLLLKAYGRGEFGAREIPTTLAKLPKLRKLIDDLEKIPDDVLLRYGAAYADGASSARLGIFGPRVGWDRARFDAEILRRRKGLRADFERLLGQASDARDKALGATKAKVAKAVTPIDEKWIKAVRASKAKGRTVFVGGRDVEDGHLLAYPTKNDGLWIEGKLRAGADAKIARLAEAAGLPVPGTSAATSAAALEAPADPFHDAILSVFKSYNAHLDPTHPLHDGIVPQKTIEAASKLSKQLNGLKNLGAMSPDESAMAAHYLEQLQTIGYFEDGPGTAWVPYVKHPKTAANGFKFAPHAPKVSAPVPPPAAPPISGLPDGVQVRKIKWGNYSKAYKGNEVVLDEAKFLEWPEHDGYRVVGGAMDAYEIDLGAGVKVHYRPHGPGEREYSEQGAFRIWFTKPAKTVTAEDVSLAFERLQGIGIDTNLATAEDLEALYLRKVAHVAGRLSEPEFAAIGEDLPAAEQVQRLTAAWEKHVGKGFRTKAAYRDRLQWDTGDFDGRPRWMRFDTAEELGKAHDEGWRIVHGLGVEGKELADRIAVLLDGTEGLASLEERLRLGIQTRDSLDTMGLASNWRDRNSGGGSYVFTRVRAPGTSDRDHLVFDFRLAGDVNAVSYDHDAYGEVVPSYITRRKNQTVAGIKECAATSRNNETNFKDRLGLLRWLDQINVSNKADRDRVLKVFADRGIREIRGKSVEDLVKARYDW